MHIFIPPTPISSTNVSVPPSARYHDAVGDLMFNRIVMPPSTWNL